MPLEAIVRRSFPQSDRAAAQERVAREVERDPEKFLARYLADPRSRGGRYVNSDLMKETFDDYGQSLKARNRYNAPVHNAAAVLASEQYRRVVSDGSDAARGTAVFLTGIPGAGKTTLVLGSGELPLHVRVLYEGQLSNPDHVLPGKSRRRSTPDSDRKSSWFTCPQNGLCSILCIDSRQKVAAQVSRPWPASKAACQTVYALFKPVSGMPLSFALPIAELNNNRASRLAAHSRTHLGGYL